MMLARLGDGLPGSLRNSLRNFLRTGRLTLELLLGRRLVLFLIADLALLCLFLMKLLLDTDADAQAAYTALFVVPSLLFGPFALAGLVDVERRAGCLDLALASPSAEGYFLRRAGSVCGLLCAQGWLLMLFNWLTATRKFPLAVVFLQVALVCVFLAAVALFWAVRLGSSGAVWLASVATVAALGRWFFANPIPDRLAGVYNAWVLGSDETLAWLPSAAVLAASSLVFFLYARRRLRRPETLIS
jgi:hypothetical protein